METARRMPDVGVVDSPLKLWSALGMGAVLGALVAATGLTLSRCDRASDRAERQELRLARVERGVDRLLSWARVVSAYEGWPAPPEPISQNSGCSASAEDPDRLAEVSP